MLKNKYTKPFWHGLFHALSITFYTLFISFVWLAVLPYLSAGVGPEISLIFTIFILILSFAVVSYFIFFEPFKLIVHHHFKAATVMITSTLAWLLVFFIIFVIGFITMQYS